MADDKRKTKPKRRSARSTALAGLLAVVALVAIWLSDCIPGFGTGAGSKDSEGEQAEPAEPAEPAKPAEPEPAEPEPTPAEEPERKPTPMQLTIDARGCSIAGADPIDCASLCEDEARFANVDTVIIDAKDGPQAAVEAALDCAKAKGLPVKVTRE